MQRWRRYYECALQRMCRASTLLDRVKHLPKTDLANVTGCSPILVVAPHPDDESLGCGGLIAETIRLGREVHIVVVTDGARSHPKSITHPKQRLQALRRAETIEAAAILGVPGTHVSFLSIPDGHAPHFGKGARAAGQRLAALARDVAATTLFTSWDYDMHPDHVASHRYARMAARATDVRLFSYPVWAWLLPPDTLVPNLHLEGFAVDIQHSVAVKRAAVLSHRSQTTEMIADDPSGFTLSEEHLRAMITSEEYFIAETL